MDAGTAHGGDTCAHCQSPLLRPLKCSLCKSRVFCSKDCQVQDWSAGHKKCCPGKKKKQLLQAGEDQEELIIAEVSAANPRLKYMPLIPSSAAKDRDHFRATIDAIALSLPSEFCWTPTFHPPFLAALMYEGFLPMANKIAGAHKYCVLPKLHQMRCILALNTAVRVRKKTRAACRSLQLSVSVDTDFDGVVAGCIRQHGHSWLYPPLIAALREMHAKGPVMPMGHASGGTTDRGERAGGGLVCMHSIEVFDGQGVLVAGELGYRIGACYTSMSGFSELSGAGSVQCGALGVLLKSRGLRFWDLGMSMGYKLDLGASDVPRQRFLTMLRAVRDQPLHKPLSMQPRPASDILCPRFACNDRVRRAHNVGCDGGGQNEATVTGSRDGVFVRLRWDGGQGESLELAEELELLGVALPASAQPRQPLPAGATSNTGVKTLAHSDSTSRDSNADTFTSRESACQAGPTTQETREAVSLAHTTRWRVQMVRRQVGRARLLDRLSPLLQPSSLVCSDANVHADEVRDGRVSRRDRRLWTKLTRR